MPHPQGPFKSLLEPKPVTALPAPASFQAPAMQEASISIPQTSTTRSSSEVETRQGDAATRNVHFILNSKGGGANPSSPSCWRSTTAICASPFFALMRMQRQPLFHAHGGTILNARRFDEMLEPILAEDAHCIVDTGTSSFVAISHPRITPGRSRFLKRSAASGTSLPKPSSA